MTVQWKVMKGRRFNSDKQFPATNPPQEWDGGAGEGEIPTIELSAKFSRTSI